MGGQITRNALYGKRQQNAHNFLYFIFCYQPFCSPLAAKCLFDGALAAVFSGTLLLPTLPILLLSPLRHSCNYNEGAPGDAQQCPLVF